MAIRNARARLRLGPYEVELDTGSADDVLRALDTHGASLKIALGGRHLDNLRKIANARGTIEAVPSPSAQPFSTNHLEAAEGFVGMGAPQMASRVFAVQSGRTSACDVATDIFSRFMRSRSRAGQAAIFREALYNPEVARSLANMAFVMGAPKEKARRLNVRLFNLGMGSREEDQGAE